jgi:6-pyruvoyltetrahydropterin/6-carboxytetrahydropterin synthase
MIELRQSFGFEAAHTLERSVDTDSSLRVHGHSYRAELVLRGEPDPASGMLVDLGTVSSAITQLRGLLDHRLLDAVEGLGPPTMENLARYVFEHARPMLPALAAAVIHRDSLGQSCVFEP